MFWGEILGLSDDTFIPPIIVGEMIDYIRQPSSFYDDGCDPLFLRSKLATSIGFMEAEVRHARIETGPSIDEFLCGYIERVLNYYYPQIRE